MQRVRRRDVRAFEVLYDRHHRLVYGLALRLLGEIPSAEDVTQAVFLTLWSVPSSFERGNFPAWVGRVTRNKCLDILRRNTRHPASELTEDIPSSDTPEEAAVARLEAGAVRNALKQIAPEQSTLIELAFFGGFTQQRIAERTGIPLGTVKTRIRAALGHLRRILAEGSIT